LAAFETTASRRTSVAGARTLRASFEPRVRVDVARWVSWGDSDVALTPTLACDVPFGNPNGSVSCAYGADASFAAPVDDDTRFTARLDYARDDAHRLGIAVGFERTY
jgi:hypothetical protein